MCILCTICLVQSFQNKDHGMQKKAYRVLEEICASTQPACQNFVQNRLEELQRALLDSLPSATSPAKRVRKGKVEPG